MLSFEPESSVMGRKSGLILDTEQMSVKRTFEKPFAFSSRPNTFCISKSGSIAAILETKQKSQVLVELNEDYETFCIVKDLSKK